MATYRARVSADPAAGWVASAVELPHCWSRGSTREEAIERLRAEIRYRIELCPCSGVDDEFVQVDVVPLGLSEAHPATPLPTASLSGALGCPPEPSRRPGAAPRVGSATERSQGADRSDEGRRAPADAGSGVTQRGLGWRRWDD